jgi:cytidylate kinase
MKDRIKRIAELQKITAEKARDYVEKSDKKRAGYYNYFSNKAWGVAESYHLCINSSVLGIDETVDLIRQLASKRFDL